VPWNIFLFNELKKHLLIPRTLTMRRTNNRAGGYRDGHGFPEMNHERQREIESRRGHHSHGGHRRNYDDGNYNGRSGGRYGDDDDDYTTGHEHYYEYERPAGYTRGSFMDEEHYRRILGRDRLHSHNGYDRDDSDGYSENGEYAERYEEEDYYEGRDYRSRGSNRRHGGQGFASMNEARVREIAAMGGRAAHRSGHAHEFTPEEARRAGRLRGRTKRGSR
jgi:hypothetical protein